MFRIKLELAGRCDVDAGAGNSAALQSTLLQHPCVRTMWVDRGGYKRERGSLASERRNVVVGPLSRGERTEHAGGLIVTNTHKSWHVTEEPEGIGIGSTRGIARSDYRALDPPGSSL